MKSYKQYIIEEYSGPKVFMLYKPESEKWEKKNVKSIDDIQRLSKATDISDITKNEDKWNNTRLPWVYLDENGKLKYEIAKGATGKKIPSDYAFINKKVTEESNPQITYNIELVDEIASLLHDQWMDLVNGLIKRGEISQELQDKWSRDSFVTYDKLSPKMQEIDRVFARRIVTHLDIRGYSTK